MKKWLLGVCCLLLTIKCYCWGFFAHPKINYSAVFLLPPEMMLFYKPNIGFISEHAVDPDKRRYAVAEEGPRHYIDIDVYGAYPYTDLPRSYRAAVEKYGEDSLKAHGIVPWHIQVMLARLTNAFKAKDYSAILKNSADIGHYIADAHVPLHTSSNHNGQLTNQHGIHGFWESRVPELLSEREFDFFIGKAEYIRNPLNYTWERVLESAKAADSVLLFEATLSKKYSTGSKYAFEERNGKVIRQYAASYTVEYNTMLDGMIERRMRTAIHSVASFWFTAWVNAGQPDLSQLANKKFSEAELKEFEEMNSQWQAKDKMIGRQEE